MRAIGVVVLWCSTLLVGNMSAATWYVRVDGGTRFSSSQPDGQCDGLADAPYPGRGKNQHCAFKSWMYLFTDDSYGSRKWVISGGDTVILKGAGPYRVGYKGPNGKDFWGSCDWNPYDCYNPTIPAGGPERHTRILGENHATCGSRNKTKLFGGFGLYGVLNLKGAKYVDVECLEITDHSDCVAAGPPVPYPKQCKTSLPIDDYASIGILTDAATSDISLRNLDIHGMTNAGILGAIGGPIEVLNVRVGLNGRVGWSFDSESHQRNSPRASVIAKGLIVEANGCNEEYPVVHNFPAISCYDQSSNGYGDGIGTQDSPLNFSCVDCVFRYNTQDGLDLLHAAGGKVSIVDSESYANLGQQWKFGGMSVLLFKRNITVHNCRRMSERVMDAPVSFNRYLGDFCRAAGDGIELAFRDGSTYIMQNNSYVGYGATSYDIECATASCKSASLVFQNNLNIAYSNPTYANGEFPGLFYYGKGASEAIFVKRDHNIYFRFRTGAPCPSKFSSETCENPRLRLLPPFVNEASLDSIDFRLSAGSPARMAGVPIEGGAPISIGALNE